MRTLISLSAACLLAIASIGPVAAKTIHVRPGQSVAAAIASAKSGDTVKIDAGVYNEPAGSAVTAPNVEIDGANGTIIQGTWTLSGADFGSHGIFITFPNTTINNVTFRGYFEGVHIEGAGCRVTGDTLTGCGTGLFVTVDNSGSTLPAATTVDRNTITNNATGISFSSVQNANVTRNVVNFNGTDGFGAGMLMGGLSYCTIASNTVAQNAGDGINLASSDHVLVSGNIVSGNAAANPGHHADLQGSAGFAGINVNGATNTCVFSLNIVNCNLQDGFLVDEISTGNMFMLNTALHNTDIDAEDRSMGSVLPPATGPNVWLLNLFGTQFGS